MIEVQDLTKSYGAIEALRGVSFKADRGEVIGLLGPNGAGKSTLMRILTGYLAPTSGSAKVMGGEVIEAPQEAQRHIGYLPEGNPLYLEFRLIEALRFSASMHGLTGNARERAIEEAVEAAGLQGLERRRISTFSRGYRQRVGLAKALLHKPPILILDEPSSGLDPNQQLEMRRFILGLRERCCVIFSTHILPEVMAVCDRALVVSKGQLVADDTVAGILAKSAGGRVGVLVAGDPRQAVSAWSRLPEAADVQFERAPGGRHRVWARLRAPADAALPARFASALSSAGFVDARVAVEPTSLESVFADLTQGDQASGSAPEAAVAEEVAS